MLIAAAVVAFAVGILIGAAVAWERGVPAAWDDGFAAGRAFPALPDAPDVETRIRSVM